MTTYLTKEELEKRYVKNKKRMQDFHQKGTQFNRIIRKRRYTNTKRDLIKK